jgi:hypothetical protein
LGLGNAKAVDAASKIGSATVKRFAMAGTT